MKLVVKLSAQERVVTLVTTSHPVATLFDGVPVRINLIDINDRRPDGQRRATDAERNTFHDALSARGLPVIRRYSVGRSRDAACGMLASRRTTALSGVA